MAPRMIITVLVLAAAASVAGCATSFDSQGFDDIGPVVWTAYRDCGDGYRPLAAGEVTELLDGWACQPRGKAWTGDDGAPTNGVDCWRGEAEARVILACESDNVASSMTIGASGDSCQIQIVCKGGAL